MIYTGFEPNYLSDLKDGDFNDWTNTIGQDNKQTTTKTHIALNTKITKLDDLFVGSYPTTTGAIESLYLGDYIQRLPHGIVDKQLTGFGATTLEITCERNSIVVVPTKTLAYNKAQKHPKALYVGSQMEERKATTPKEIRKYLDREDIPYKKLIVVADSLKKVIGVLSEEEHLNYFLMIDEIDLLQEDSNYRPSLEDAMDYYFEFPLKNRCLISATIREFSHPYLRKEARFLFPQSQKERREITLIRTYNINDKVRELLEGLAQDTKILIAYNSIVNILCVINALPPNLQKECGILCSEASEGNTGGLRRTLGLGHKLPRRINFATCCYFTGVDIEDSYHLITVSNAEKSYQALSLDRIDQIYGRCRTPYRVLSETVLFSLNFVFSHRIGYKEDLLLKTKKVMELQRATQNIAGDNQDLKRFFEQINILIEEHTTDSLAGEKPIGLLRTNKDGKTMPAYFNIDYLLARNDTLFWLYTNSQLYDELAKRHKIKKYEQETKEDRPESLIQQDIKETTKAEQAYVSKQIIAEAIQELKELEKQGGVEEAELNKKIRYSKRAARQFYKYFKILYPYVDCNSLCTQLGKVTMKNEKAYKMLLNGVIFWALDDKHPFKRNMLDRFKVGHHYTSAQIGMLLKPIVLNQLHKNLQVKTARKYVSLLKSCLEIKRVRNPAGYKVIGKNPFKFKQHKQRIAIEEYLVMYMKV